MTTFPGGFARDVPNLRGAVSRRAGTAGARAEHVMGARLLNVWKCLVFVIRAASR